MGIVSAAHIQTPYFRIAKGNPSSMCVGFLCGFQPGIVIDYAFAMIPFPRGHKR